MTDFAMNCREIDDVPGPALDYSICTLMTNENQYRAMVESFIEAGFTTDRCEFIYADNRAGNKADGYRGLNRMIAAARGRYVVMTHQDVLPIDPASQLDKVLAELTQKAPDWAVVGNAGYDKRAAALLSRITDPFQFDTQLVDAARVASLDENFLIVRKEFPIGFSHDLTGFHLYGTDLVAQANLRGGSAWVVDFHVEHTGLGLINRTFLDCLEAVEAKYARVFKGRAVRTPIAWVGLGKQTWKTRQAKYKIKRRVHGGWRLAVSDAVKSLRTRTNRAFGFPLANSKYVLNGLSFEIPGDVPAAARNALRKGRYEKHERDLIEKYLSVDLPAVELGGSYGVVSTVLRRKISEERQLVVVEANPDLVPICSGNVRRLGGDGETVLINKALAYGETQTVPFKVTAGIHTSHVAKPCEDGVAMVQATTLGAILAEHGIDGPYSLVCDIEGHEFDLLEQEPGALANCAMMIVEVHPLLFYEQGRSVRDFRRMIDRAGFKIVETSGTVIAAQRVKAAAL